MSHCFAHLSPLHIHIRLRLFSEWRLSRHLESDDTAPAARIINSNNKAGWQNSPRGHTACLGTTLTPSLESPIDASSAVCTLIPSSRAYLGVIPSRLIGLSHPTAACIGATATMCTYLGRYVCKIGLHPVRLCKMPVYPEAHISMQNASRHHASRRGLSTWLLGRNQ